MPSPRTSLTSFYTQAIDDDCTATGITFYNHRLEKERANYTSIPAPSLTRR
jgi:hypothetical protein